VQGGQAETKEFPTQPHAPDPEDKEIAPGLKQLSQVWRPVQVWRTEMTLRKGLNASQTKVRI